MASVGIKLSDQTYGLAADQAQFLAGQLQRRLGVMLSVAELSDQLWEQSTLNPDAGQTSRDIALNDEQKHALLDTLTRGRHPSGETAAWDALANALRQELDESGIGWRCGGDAASAECPK